MQTNVFTPAPRATNPDEIVQPMKIRKPIKPWIALLASVLLTANLAQAANLLSNGDFSSPNSTAPADNWTRGAAGGWYDHKILDNVFSHGVDNTGIYDFTYAVQLGLFNTTGESSIYQVVGGGPNVTYTLTCDSGAEAWWLPYGEIRLIFLNGASAAITTNVVRITDSIHAEYGGNGTNYYDVGVVMQRWTNVTVSPVGTAFVKVELLCRVAGAGGNIWFDNVELTSPAVPPVVANVYPNGAVLQQVTNTLSFTATSAQNITNIVLVLNGSNVSGNLVITGPATSRTCSYANLESNKVYSATITATDDGNLSGLATVNFDTFNPIVAWEAEDYDFNNGVFIANPVLSSTPGPNNYYQVTGTLDADYHDINAQGTTTYRSFDFMATEVASDTPRQAYLTAQVGDPLVQDYNVGFFGVGEWLNHTRTFPAGNYNIYGRYASGGGQGVQSLSIVTNGAGTTNQQVQPVGEFKTDNTGGWGTFKYFPLRDTSGNLLSVALNGQTTLRIEHTSGSDANCNFFMAVPAVVGLPTITQVTPIGWLQSTNKLSFVASSAAGIATNNVTVTLNGVAVPNLAFTGSATSWNVSCPLAPNVVYTAVLTVTANNAQVATTTVNFDTFSATSFTWEAEDWDYNGGLFIDNPQTNGYVGLSGVLGIDYLDFANGGGQPYRAVDNVAATEACGDLARPQYNGTGMTDYNVGYNSGGEWLNFTRTFPTGKFNVYLRAARGQGGTGTMGLQQVTSGWGTSNQVTAPLGIFTLGDTGGWQSYQWVPLQDGNGQLAAVTLGGQSTLRLTDGAGNVNFLTLVPALLLQGSRNGADMQLSFGTQTGFNYTVEYKNDLTAASWLPLPLSTVSGDGTTKTVLDPMGTARFYRLKAH
jgi:hypothetical protein